MAVDRTPSEYGGTPGRVAGGEHPFAAIEGVTHEYARLMRATNPMDAADTPEAALARERIREGR